jgi:adenylate cyclase
LEWIEDRMTDNAKNDELWRRILSGEMKELIKARSLFKHIPSDPRCRVCLSPFHGIGGQFTRIAFKRTKSKINPHFCSACYDLLSANPGGAEVEMTLLFADIRGSTTLAQQLGTADFSRLINRFYIAATHVFSETNAWIERLVGDQVIGLYLPAMAGQDHARVAIQGAQDLLRAVGYGGSGDAWLPLGVGVHTGVTFMGMVGTDTGMRDITVLGDPANTSARLSSVAAAGEILISETTIAHSRIDTSGLEMRNLALKGRAEPINACVAHLNTPIAVKQ